MLAAKKEELKSSHEEDSVYRLKEELSNSKITETNREDKYLHITHSIRIDGLNTQHNGSSSKSPQRMDKSKSSTNVTFPSQKALANMKIRPSQSPKLTVGSRASRRKSMPINTKMNKHKGYGRIESYQKLEKLGEGTYANVYRGISIITGEQCALKVINLDQEEGAPCTAIREASLLRELKHVNIVILHDIIHTQATMTFVFEYLDMDLKDYINRAGHCVNLKNVQLFFFQLLRGLDACGRKRILHRDIKPQNILLNEIGELKLADFGLARAKGVPIKSFSNEVVTLWYRPLDILLGSVDYNTSIDIWSAGCILAELVTGSPLFPGKNHENQILTIFQKKGTPVVDSWAGVERLPSYSPKWPVHKPVPLKHTVPRLEADGLDLLERMIVYNPQNRINTQGAMYHDYFKSLPSEIYELNDDQSIFSIPEIRLRPEIKLGKVDRR